MIAIIAGTGSLPIEAGRCLQRRGENFFVISLFPQDNLDILHKELNKGVSNNPGLTAGALCKGMSGRQAGVLLGGSFSSVNKPIEILSQDFYKIGAILKLLQEREAKAVLFVGKVDKRHLLRHISFDMYALKLLASLCFKSDRDIMDSLINELSNNNIKVLSQDDILSCLLVPAGVLSGALTQELSNDIDLGMKTARLLSQSAIGQTVVVKSGMVIALEAIEGTDECVSRGISLGKGGVVVCKSACTSQSKKYDLPTLGPLSLEGLNAGDVLAIAWDSKHTFIIDREKFIKRAQDLRITLVSCA